MSAFDNSLDGRNAEIGKEAHEADLFNLEQKGSKTPCSSGCCAASGTINPTSKFNLEKIAS